MSIKTETRCEGVPRGEAGAKRLKGIGEPNGTVDRSGITLLILSIRIPLQSLRDSFPSGDAFVARIRLYTYPFQLRQLVVWYSICIVLVEARYYGNCISKSSCNLHDIML